MKGLDKKYIPAIFALLFLVTRLYKLDSKNVWEDNFSWLYRINYYPWIIMSNLKGTADPDRNLKYAGTISYHPGVTVMSVSGLTTKIGKSIYKKVDPLYKDCAFADKTCPYLSFELFIAKLPLILIYTALIFYSIYLIQKNFGLPASIIFSLYILFEPIFLTTSRDLHLDFLQSSIMLAVLLTLLDKASDTNAIAGGVLFGFSLLTRFASIFFVPGILLTIGFSHPQKIKRLFLFALSAIAIFFACYPPMWKYPLQTLKYMVAGSSDSVTVVTAYVSPFHGYADGFRVYLMQSTNNINGVTIIWIAGALISLVAAVMHFKQGPSHRQNQILSLFFSALFYFLLLNVSDKRYFRYVTPMAMIFTVCLGYYLQRLGEQLLPSSRKTSATRAPSSKSSEPSGRSPEPSA